MNKKNDKGREVSFSLSVMAVPEEELCGSCHVDPHRTTNSTGSYTVQTIVHQRGKGDTAFTEGSLRTPYLKKEAAQIS